MIYPDFVMKVEPGCTYVLFSSCHRTNDDGRFDEEAAQTKREFAEATGATLLIFHTITS